MVDHRNGDKLDNRTENLRPATIKENNRNKRAQRNGRSGFKGVAWDSTSGRWKAHIYADGKRYVLGYFEDPRDAARAYNEAAPQYHGEFARLNDLDNPLPQRDREPRAVKRSQRLRESLRAPFSGVKRIPTVPESRVGDSKSLAHDTDASDSAGPTTQTGGGH